MGDEHGCLPCCSLRAASQSTPQPLPGRTMNHCPVSCSAPAPMSSPLTPFCSLRQVPTCLAAANCLTTYSQAPPAAGQSPASTAPLLSPSGTAVNLDCGAGDVSQCKMLSGRPAMPCQQLQALLHSSDPCRKHPCQPTGRHDDRPFRLVSPAAGCLLSHEREQRGSGKPSAGRPAATALPTVHCQSTTGAPPEEHTTS